MACRVFQEPSPYGLRGPRTSRTGRLPCAATKTIHSTEAGTRLQKWLLDNGAPPQQVLISRNNQGIDTVVAKESLAAGDLALQVPEHLCVTLSRVFRDDTLAELLTTNKLSELAILALYMMYEKKRGDESFFKPFIRELDARRGRGHQAVESPLLWSQEEVEAYLAGSPVLAATRQRLRSIQREYEELDTVWFMAGSLFQDYPYEQPSTEFSFDIFLQAFCAVQSCVTHLQHVPLAKRFALVPLGPPILSYRSTSQAMLTYSSEQRQVQLVVDRDYGPGDPIYAWCGPQPNSRLLINYGIVDESNPYDKLQVKCSLDSHDALFRLKREVLQQAKLTSQQLFNLDRTTPLPPSLLPFLRLAYAETAEEAQQVDFAAPEKPISSDNESRAMGHLRSHLQQRLDGYRTSLAEDDAIIEAGDTPQRQRVAHRLLRIEKGILHAALGELQQLAGEAPSNGAQPHASPGRVTLTAV